MMGRMTWEALGGRPLAGRRNLVVTARDLPGVECFRDIPRALEAAEGAVWFFGGARIYHDAMPFADLIDLVYVPDHVTDPNAVKFPPIDPLHATQGRSCLTRTSLRYSVAS